MFFVKDTYATVWKVEDKGKYSSGRISTSEKDNRDETKYINSNWFCKFVGKAKEDCDSLNERDRIKIIKGKISNTMIGDEDNRRSFLDMVIFEYEKVESFANSGNKAPTSNIPEEEDDDDVPW